MQNFGSLIETRYFKRKSFQPLSTLTKIEQTSFRLQVQNTFRGSLKMFAVSCRHHHLPCQIFAFGVRRASPLVCPPPSPSLQSPSWASWAWPQQTSLATLMPPPFPCPCSQTPQTPWNGPACLWASLKGRSPCGYMLHVSACVHLPILTSLHICHVDPETVCKLLAAPINSTSQRRSP